LEQTLCDRHLFHQFPRKHVDKFDTTYTQNISEEECETPQKTLAEFDTYHRVPGESIQIHGFEQCYTRNNGVIW
jgi:hypothetical protein